MINVNGVLENLKQLIGCEFNNDDVICAFEDFEENGESSVVVNESHNSGYDYIAYIDAQVSTQFLFTVDEHDVITNAWIH